MKEREFAPSAIMAFIAILTATFAFAQSQPTTRGPAEAALPPGRWQG